MSVFVTLLTVFQALVMYSIVLRLAPRQPRESAQQPAERRSLPSVVLWGALAVAVTGIALVLDGMPLSEFVAIGAFMWIPIAGVILVGRRYWSRQGVEVGEALPSSLVISIAVAGLALTVVAVLLARLVEPFLAMTPA